MTIWGQRLLSGLALAAFAMGCNAGGCGGCVDPLPAGVNLPGDQTVEGGAQIRVTPSGFATFTDLLTGVLNDTFAGGFCVPSNTTGIGIGNIDFCHQDDGTCTPGCQADFNVDFLDVTVPTNNALNIRTQFDIDVDIPIRFRPFFGGSVGCDMDAVANNNLVTANINFTINPTTGELEINLSNIPDLNINLNVSGCGLVSTVINAVVNLITSALGVGFIRDLLQPLLEDLVRGLLPSPLGIVGMVDGRSLLPGVAPETNAKLEMRLVPGGYVFLEGNGMSVGMISGINADEDQSTRTAALDSEPALCVPPIPAPNFAAPPASLNINARGNFNLLPAGAFRGQPDPVGTDLIIGASETTLDQLGHHLVTSGGLCLGVGTELVSQLTLGTFGLLVPSLSELGNDEDPMLIVTRPQSAIDFSIGQGTAADPALTISLRNFEVDFYGFVFERYTRAFTLALDLDVGVNLEFTVDANGDPAIIPMLQGIDSNSIGLTVLNEEFIRESAADLELLLPTLLEALLPQLTNGLPPIALPSFGGFTMTNLVVTKVTTPEDDFLAIAAELGASQTLISLGMAFPSVAKMVGAMEPLAAPIEDVRASLRSVTAPSPAEIRQGIIAGDAERLPTIALNVDQRDAFGRPLEWAWNIDGGVWRPFQSGSPLVIRDRAFVLQGHYNIELMSRVVGDYTTTSQEIVEIPVVIDSAPPRIYGEKLEARSGMIIIPVADLVSAKEAVSVAYGPLGALAPTTAWMPIGRLSAALAQELASASDTSWIRVFASDERGNSGSADVDLGDLVQFHGSGDAAGCQCDASAGAGSFASGLLLVALTVLLAWGSRRRRSLARIVGLLAGLVAVSTISACSCGSAGEELACTEGQVVVCFDEAMEDCACTLDIRYGNIGQYSELAVGPDGTYWVSAYNDTHGDLMVANVNSPGRIANESWQFVDGVPEGPVIPGLSVRGGVREPGPNTGLYTDIALSGSGRVFVSYFSAEDGGLHVAVNDSGIWSTHLVDDGMFGEVETGFEIAGQYSSVAVRTADERPMIAYFVSIGEVGERRTELRLARASSATPGSAGDWTVETIETTPVVDDGGTDVLTIPMGSGLFVNTVVRSDDEPIIAYYDRVNGDLKLAQMTAGAWAIEILDGTGVDVGWYPGIAIDSVDTVHVSYVSASSDDLLYVNTLDRVVEVVDDGYRIVGTTEEGLPKPEFHFVGDDSSIVLTGAGPIAVYQDATNHELLVAGKDGTGNWVFQTVAGNEDPFVGGYGFYASAEAHGAEVAMSTYVVDQPAEDAWVEVFVRQVVIE